MAKNYDNIDDVKSKLVGTIIYYEDVPVIVKGADKDLAAGGFCIIITNSLTSRGSRLVNINDPKLNWIRFNLGYSNNGEYGSMWWYRKPLRQYRQGLKGEQMNYKVSEKSINTGTGFGPCKSVDQMLKDEYPTMDEVERMLKNAASPVVAFHKDFAMSWDKIHKDMIIEYKGTLIGCANPMLTNISLAAEFQHLMEPLREVVNVR